MAKISIPTNPPVGEMARAARTGNMVFISGQIARLEDGSMPTEFDEQARIIFDKISSELAALNGNLSNVVKVTCFLARRQDIPAYREIRRKAFASDPPASSTVLVAGLIHPQALIEIEAIAVLD